MSVPRPRSLRRLLAMVLVGTMVLALASVGVIAYAYISSEENQAWEGRQTEAANRAASRVGQFIDTSKGRLLLAASLHHYWPNAGQDELRVVLESYPAITEIVILDRDGRVEVGSYIDRPLLANQFTIAQSNWFRAAREGRSYLGQPQSSPDGMHYIIIAIPGPGGSIAAARLETDVLHSVVRDARFGRGGGAYVVDNSGVVIAHSDPSRVDSRSSLTGRPEFDATLSSPDHRWTGEYNDLDGVAVVGVTAPVPATDWIVMSELPVSEAYQASRSALPLLALAIIVIGALGLAGTMAILSRVVLNPLEQLRRGAEHTGDGHFTLVEGVSPKTEIGHVAESFNQMVERLRDRERQLAARTAALSAEAEERARAQDELERLNRELEGRVERRTSELAQTNLRLQDENAERHRTELALRASEERYALASRGANDGLWDWDLLAGSLYVSERWGGMLGHPEGEIARHPDAWLRRVHPDDVDQLQLDLAAHLDGLTDHLENEHRLRHKDGTYVWILCRGMAIRDDTGLPLRLAGSLTDITARKRTEEQLMHDALHDTLTDLPNRTLFLDRLEMAIERRKREPEYRFAVLFLDFDRFKVINDSLGHKTGDALLIAAAREIKDSLRPTDTVARLGGDEFAILLDRIADLDDAELVAVRINEMFDIPVRVNGHEVYVTASIGVVAGDAAHTKPAEMLRDADIAMYRAKAAGRACHVVFREDMRATAEVRLSLETDMRRALERAEFTVHYQPIVCLSTGRLAGFEALARWQHPERGLVPPGDFIPLAEETGLIVPIGRHILRTACRQLARWRHEFSGGSELTVSVNVSSRQLTHDDLVEQVEAALEEAALEPTALVVELTESAIIHDHDAVADIMRRLRVLGVRVHLDDFGTGYSSLSYLHQLPIDALKIDRSFIARLDREGEEASIVRTILTLAGDMGMGAIAEGVETAEQLARLKELACGHAQGYLFAAPRSPQALESLLGGAECEAVRELVLTP